MIVYAPCRRRHLPLRAPNSSEVFRPQRRCIRNIVGAARDIVKRNREIPYFSFLIRRVLMPSQSYPISISPCAQFFADREQYLKGRLRETYERMIRILTRDVLFHAVICGVRNHFGRKRKDLLAIETVPRRCLVFRRNENSDECLSSGLFDGEMSGTCCALLLECGGRLLRESSSRRTRLLAGQCCSCRNSWRKHSYMLVMLISEKYEMIGQSAWKRCTRRWLTFIKR